MTEQPEQTVWVVTIDHRHGTDMSVHRTFDGAYARLAAWVDEWWETEIGDEKPQPTDDVEAVDQYFDMMNGVEWYTINQMTVEG